MTGLIHALNVGTFATWTSIAALGGVGLLVNSPDPRIPERDLKIDLGADPGQFAVVDLGQEDAPDAAADGEASPETPEETPEPEAVPEVPEAPPEMEPLPELEPLPDVPMLPPVRKAEPTPPRSESPPEKKPAVTRSTPPKRQGVPGGTGTAAINKGAANGTRGGTGSSATGGTGGMSEGQRFAGGRMPAPYYPETCRKAGQQGTVLVEFTVGANGAVTSVRAARNSPWPQLDQAALNAVRRWKFKPGPVMTARRPIVFRIQ